MNLELKHLAAYLPYGITVYGSSELWKLFGIDKVVNGEIFVNLENVNGNPTANYYRSASMYEHSLVLRPLSDLTKEIEMNGERFVPIKKISIYGDNKAYLEEAILTGLVEVIVFNMLLSWHFDVFGLIEKGLAIDVNTLK